MRLQTEQDPERPNPIYLPAAAQAARWFAKRTGGIAQSALTESIQNIPTTAHILGGAVVGADPESGVVDAGNRVFGYENLLVTDGAAMPGQPRRQPEPDDHRQGRARDEPGPAQGRERAAPPARGGAAAPRHPVAA